MPARWRTPATAQSALNAFDELVDKGSGCCRSARPRRSAAASRRLRGSEEQAVLTPELRDAIIAWLDAAAAAVETVAARSVRLLRDRGAARRRLSQRAAAHSRRLVAGERRRSARAAPARRRSSLPDGVGRAAMAALRPHVDRRGRAAARPARPMPGPRSAQAAHRAASAAGALALAADAGLRRALRRSWRIAPRASRTGCSPRSPKAFRRRLEALWEHGR